MADQYLIHKGPRSLEEIEIQEEANAAGKSDLARRMALAVNPYVGKGPTVILESCAKAFQRKIESQDPLSLKDRSAAIKAAKPPKKIRTEGEKRISALKAKETRARNKKARLAKEAQAALKVELRPGIFRLKKPEAPQTSAPQG